MIKDLKYEHVSFNREWMEGKSEAEFVAEFKDNKAIGLSEAKLKEAWKLAGIKPKEVKAEVKK